MTTAYAFVVIAGCALMLIGERRHRGWWPDWIATAAAFAAMTRDMPW